MPAVRESHPTRPDAAPIAQKGSRAAIDIIDIRRNLVDFDLKDEVHKLMNPSGGAVRSLPTLLLYNEKGLQLFEEITYLDEYYLTNSEIELLELASAEIAQLIPAGSMVIELGSGNLRKVSILLQAFEKLRKPIEYFALDLSREELERTLACVPSFEFVSCRGLLGTYDDGQEWLQRPDVVDRSKCILHLGSSIGNFDRHAAADFLHSFADALQPTDTMIMGIDTCNDPHKVYRAYNDKNGTTHQFVLNGLDHANDIFGETVFSPGDWRVIGEYIFDEEGGRHQAFVSPFQDTTVLGSDVMANERIKIEQSLKYSALGLKRLWQQSGLAEAKSWKQENNYGLHILRKAKLPFSKIPQLYARHSLPTIQDWESLWAAWHIVTKQMIPDQELHEKPIKLRNACIFYLGHIPTFLDIQLTKTTNEPPTEPKTYYSIFERGIDPDVDNPERCHDHSEIPDSWPPANEIAAYQVRVRERLRVLYAKGPENIPRVVGRAIWLGFEHELMHIETLLYMLLQSDKTLPPPHTYKPDFADMARVAAANRVDNKWFNIPAQEINLGMDDPAEEENPNAHHGWDNEKPARKAKVQAFSAQARPITNEEYAEFMQASNIDKLPASWSLSETSHKNGSVLTDGLPPVNPFFHDKFVRTVYGLVPLEFALDWPIQASYDELTACAQYMGGRIPTFEEARSLYTYAEAQKEVDVRSNLDKKVPAVNGHLVNDGVEETPPSTTSISADGRASQLFIDLSGANVGFRHWHPVPVTGNGAKLAGQSGMGGVWEWTSSPLEKHDGFAPMPMYPGYTADFFDGKHNIVLGGSWATHPRIAGRKSFVNWYQRNYPYAWAGARLVRDI